MPTFAEYGINDVPPGTEVKTLCPKCSHSRHKSWQACLNVNTDKGLWHCWHCQAAGSLTHGWVGDYEDESDLPRREARAYIRPDFTADPLAERTVQWFARRGIPRPVLDRRKVSCCQVYMPQVRKLVDAIQFPYFRGGKVINIKFRDAVKNFRMVHKAERVFYGLDDIVGDTVYITEGEMDALSLEVAGYTSVLSVPDGAPTPGTKNYTSKFDFLLSAEDILRHMKHIVLAVDADEPGQYLAGELARRLGPERCYRVVWPEGCKDANDVLVRHGSVALAHALKDRIPWPVQGSIRIRSLTPELMQLYDEGISHGAHPGWDTLAPHFTLRPGHLTVVTGSPSYGKSQWVSALMLNMAKNHGWRWMVFSPENYPVSEYVSMLLEQVTGNAFFASTYGRMTKPDIWEAQEWLDEHIYPVDAQDDTPTVEWLVALAKIHVQRYGIHGLIIDPWNEVEHQRNGRQPETEYIGEMLQRLRRFGRQHGLHVIVVAHPTKLKKAEGGDYDGMYPPATAYDISGSANWYNKPDMIVSVWRNVRDGTSDTQIHVMKVRRKYDGFPGVVTLTFDRHSGRYYDPGTEPSPYGASYGT